MELQSDGMEGDFCDRSLHRNSDHRLAAERPGLEVQREGGLVPLGQDVPGEPEIAIVVEHRVGSLARVAPRLPGKGVPALAAVGAKWLVNEQPSGRAA
jgi:hypothetical protein